MTIDLTPIIVAVIGLIGAAIAIYLIPLLKSKAGAERWAQLEQIAHTAVNAAAQLGVTSVAEDKLADAKDKLKYATEQIEIALKRYGLVFDEATVRAAVEAQVQKLKSGA